MKKILVLFVSISFIHTCSPTRSNSDDPKSDSLRKYLPALIVDIGLANREALKTLISMPNQILKTGQSQSYVSGDDGAYLSGADRSFVKGGREGLLWQRCSSGQKNDDSCSGNARLRSWRGARDYCRNLWLGGLEWRLPTVQELNTLVDYGGSSTLIDSNVFPNTQSEYWTSNIYLKAGVTAYMVQFKSSESSIVDLAKIGERVDSNYDYYTGTYITPSGYDRCEELYDYNYDYSSQSTYYRCYDTAYVKCVSGKNSLSSPDYTDKKDGTIEDKNSDLTWQKCTAGLNSSSSTCSSGSPSSLTWTSAIAYCEGLSLDGKSDWRLPNVNELVGLLDLSVLSSPLIDPGKFPNTKTDIRYWTSTTHPADTTSAIEVSFSNGIVGLRSKNSSRYVRCVRGGKDIASLYPSIIGYNGSSSIAVSPNIPISISPTVIGEPSSFSVSPSLPTGLTLNPTTGVISGTPSNSQTSTVYSITVSNSNGSSVYTIDIAIYDRVNFNDGQIPSGWTGTGANWVITSSGCESGYGSCIRSGAIGNSSATSVSVSRTLATGSFSFRWRVSSESGYDFCRFYINGALQSGSISGSPSWASRQFTLSAGTYLFRWEYSKDSSSSSGSDACFVDEVEFQ